MLSALRSGRYVVPSVVPPQFSVKWLFAIRKLPNPDKFKLMCELGSCFKKSGQYSGSSAPLLTGFGIDLFNPYKVGMNVSLGFRQVSSEPEKIEAFYQVMLAHVHSESLTNPVFLSQCLGSESRDDVFDSVLPFLKRFCACLKVKYPSVHYKSYLDKLINSLDDSALDSGCRAKQVGVKLGLFFSSIKSGATAPLLSEVKNSALSVFSNYLILFPRDNSEKNKADFLDFLIETNFLRLGSAHHGLKSKFDDFPVFSDNVLLPGIKFLIDRNMIESPDERLKFFQLYWLLQSVSSNVSELDSACSKKADFKDQSSFKKWVGSYLSEKISPEKLADGFVSAAFLGSSSVSGGYLKPYVELKGDLISNTGKLSLKDGNVVYGASEEQLKMALPSMLEVGNDVATPSGIADISYASVMNQTLSTPYSQPVDTPAQFDGTPVPPTLPRRNGSRLFSSPILPQQSPSGSLTPLPPIAASDITVQPAKDLSKAVGSWEPEVTHREGLPVSVMLPVGSKSSLPPIKEIVETPASNAVLDSPRTPIASGLFPSISAQRSARDPWGRRAPLPSVRSGLSQVQTAADLSVLNQAQTAEGVVAPYPKTPSTIKTKNLAMIRRLEMFRKGLSSDNSPDNS